jgi:hypothetical protein
MRIALSKLGFVRLNVKETDTFCKHRKLPDTNQCNLCDRQRLAHVLPGGKRPRHYTAKRGSDAAVIGTQVRAALEVSRSERECRPDYGVIVPLQASYSSELKLRHPSTLRPGFEFIRGHCGKVAIKAPLGS